MAILITGMDMPRGCLECRFFEVNSEYCYAKDDYVSAWGKSVNCPLVEITLPIDHQKSSEENEK